MSTKNIIEFPAKSPQQDNHHSHRINRGDENMSKKSQTENPIKPIIKITLLNYDSAKQDAYSKKFMLPLIEGVLKRTEFAQAK